MLWLYVVIGLAALEVGFVLGWVYADYMERANQELLRKQEEKRRIEIIWLGVKTSLQTGRHIECHRRARDFIRVTDLPGNPMRVN